MPKWNKDLTAAPKGYYRKVAAGKGEQELFVAQQVWLASECGIVTLSYYLPREERWSMFTKTSPPIAWMPYTVPKHPSKE